MVNILPDIPDEGRYSAREAAKHLGVHYNSITTYAKEGKLKFGIRRSNRRKFYTGFEIKRFWKATA